MGSGVLYYGCVPRCCTAQFNQKATIFLWFSMCFPPKAESLVKHDGLFMMVANYICI